MEQKQSASALKFITYLQVLGIILVVLGHSLHMYPDGKGGTTVLPLACAHHIGMPLFVFVSGFLMYYTTFGRRSDGGRSWGRFSLAKAERLLVPFVVLTLVTFVPRSGLSTFSDDSFEGGWLGLFHSLVYYHQMPVPYFWFLHMAFILLVGVYGILKLTGDTPIKRNATIWALCCIFFVLPLTDVPLGRLFAINKVVFYGLYFMLGILYCQYRHIIDARLYTSSILTVILGATVWTVLFFCFPGYSHTDQFFKRLGSLFGILAFIGIARILEDRKIRVLDHLGGANYMIFLLSWYINVAAQQVLAHFLLLPWWTHTLLSLIGGIYIPWLGYRYLVRHRESRWIRASAFLLGQKIKDKRA